MSAEWAEGVKGWRLKAESAAAVVAAAAVRVRGEFMVMGGWWVEKRGDQ